MEIIFQSVGPGVHCYSPFLKNPAPNTTISLEDLCKNVILKSITLRRLATGVSQLPLPKRLIQYVTELTTMDFEQLECAPFSDVFSLNFFHRALTYRVRCLKDGQEYMISYAYSPAEDVKLIYSHEKWVQVQHKNVMCICAIVKDLSTENVFYVYDQPYASLLQLWNVFCDKNQLVPEMFFSRLIVDLCEALKYVQSLGLRYNSFGLENIFVVHDRLVIENGLMRKRTEFLSAESKKTCSDEQNMINDLICVLKQLLPNNGGRSQTECLKMLLNAITAQKSISDIIQIIDYSLNDLRTFSFVELIHNLQKSEKHIFT